jgi:hypothetical protein
MSRFRHIIAVLIAATILASAGCLGLGGTQQSVFEPSEKMAAGISYPGGTPAPSISRDMATGGPGAAQAVETKIIKTGQVTIEVPQVPVAIDRVRDIAVSNGGYLSSSSVYTSQNDRKTGYAMIRIPADRFDPVMQALAPLGKVLSSSEQRSDVTEEYVDLSIQNASYRNQLDSYNRILEKAEKVEDIIKVQVEIDRVRLELNRIEGRLRYLSSQIDLSTITVTLQEPEPVGGVAGWNIITAINEGIAGFFGMISAIIVIVFSLIPLIILAIIAYVIYRWHRKRKGGSRPTLAAPAETKA